MKQRKKTILPIGNDGFTFIEIMVTLAILSLGLTVILKSFLVSLDHLEHLTNRLYASLLLDNRISSIERTLRAYKALPFDLNHQEKIAVGAKETEFTQKMSIKEVEDYADVFQLDLTLTWQEKQRERESSRTAYISDLDYFRFQ